MSPTLSIIVIFHDMRREARRTLFSLSHRHQQNIEIDEYEIIAIDNGSSSPLDGDDVRAIGPNVRYLFHETTSVSPVDALNLGAESARGDYMAFIVDGARMATPGLVSTSLVALRSTAAPFLGSLGWHLGPDVQNRSMLDGYDQRVEDTLLDGIDWPEDGYRLFDIATLAQSSGPGFLGGFPSECSWLCISSAGFVRLGGYDTAFRSPGGGLANHDLVARAAAMDEFEFMVVLGEGVFHQFHGGVATNVAPADHPYQRFQDEYRAIRGEPYQPPEIGRVMYHGTVPPAAMRFVAGSDPAA